jgi:hypothetical protein
MFRGKGSRKCARSGWEDNGSLQKSVLLIFLKEMDMMIIIVMHDHFAQMPSHHKREELVHIKIWKQVNSNQYKEKSAAFFIDVYHIFLRPSEIIICRTNKKFSFFKNLFLTLITVIAEAMGTVIDYK